MLGGLSPPKFKALSLMENVSPGMRFIRTPLVTLLGNLCSDYILVEANSGGGRKKGKKEEISITPMDISQQVFLESFTTSVLGASSGVVKAGPGRAHAQPKFILLTCAQALVLLVQWLSIQQVPTQYQ